MTRFFSNVTDEKPRIEEASVLRFFEERARKVVTLGAMQAVIYQDKNPELAKLRDAAEKALLLPLLALQQDDRVLDAGCGTGRWAEVLMPHCAHYHGIDSSSGLIEVAQKRFSFAKNASFSVCALSALSLEKINAPLVFSKILSAGVYIYLNDDALEVALTRIASVAADNATIVLREPVATEQRLTLKEHYSDDMDQYYSAIYRTEAELHSLFQATLVAQGFLFQKSGDVYAENALNNRKETRQKFFVFERSKGAP